MCNSVRTEGKAAPPGARADAPGFVERRRPGRIANLSPELIPLVRRTGIRPPIDFGEEARADPLAAARGIVLAVVVSCLLIAGLIVLRAV